MSISMTDSMNTNKKLFLVTLQYRGYVLAEDDFDAEDIGLSVVEDERPTVEVEEVKTNVLRWPQHACVYHAEQMDLDITVADVFRALGQRQAESGQCDPFMAKSPSTPAVWDDGCDKTSTSTDE